MTNKRNKKLKVVACIPAYNEEYTIAKVVLKAMKYVDKVIVCDDGSTDMTAEIAEKLGATVIRHERNMGKGIALRDLLIEAEKFKPDIIVTLDADDQHDPSEIPKLIEPIEKGNADIVIGSRYVKGAKTDAPLYRRVGLWLINTLNKKILRITIKDTQSGFRAFAVNSLKVLKSARSKGFGIESEQLALALNKGLRVIEVPITVRYKGVKRASKKVPLLHGGEIITTMLRLLVEERSLLCLGIAGGILIIAIISGTCLLLLFNANRYFSIPIALITLGALFTGMMFLITAVILYAITRPPQKR